MASDRLEHCVELGETYLEHYGILGMKWGVRKDPDKAYEKAGAKLEKLDRKATRLASKGAAREQRALKKQSRATSAILFKRMKARSAAKATRRALQTYQKSQEKEVKAYRWNESMRKAFEDVKVSNMNEKYISLGEKYAKNTIDNIMRNNVSVNSMMSIEEYYRNRSR